ncbi:MAG: AraC family transcriptional regulator [Clostridiales bacterium]|jgi:AraC-like DNA-binding protein|nr:AraC family transcriptional regulator [Clostridiales bacterium]
MILYESFHFGEKRFLGIHESRRTEYNIPHFHRNFELLYIYDGDVTVFIDYQTVNIKTGEFVLIFPNQVHWFTDNVTSRSKLVIFSPDYVSDFYNTCKNKRPAKVVTTLDESTRQQLVNHLTKESDIFLIKSILYAVCSCVYRNTSLYELTDKVDENLRYRLICFIEENYDKQCTLGTVSKALGYSYEYLSWYFTEKLGVSFVKLLNSYRLSKAVHMLKESNLTVAEIAFGCGFDTIRSFNRNFKSRYNLTPTQYRKAL